MKILNTLAVGQRHFSVAIDWKQRTLEQWLEQYGSWLLIGCRSDNLGTKSVMGHLLDMAQGVKADHRRRAPPRCNISDDQALAIEALVNHISTTDTPKAKAWINITLAYHVGFLSEEAIAQLFCISRFAVTRDKMLGIVRVVSKHSYLQSFYTD